jgi:transposase
MCGFRRPVARTTSRLDLDKWPNRMSLACPRHVRLSRQGNLGNAGCPVLPVEGIGLDMIQALEPGPRIMRYELSDFEWAAIRSFLPNKPRGIPRFDDRRVLNGIFWVLRSGAPWRDLPETYGPRHLLQPLRSLAAGWHLGSDHGCPGRRPAKRAAQSINSGCLSPRAFATPAPYAGSALAQLPT